MTYLITLVGFVAIDMVWLGWLARSLYVAELGTLLKARPDLLAAGVFYLIYAGGLMLFAVLPGLKAGSPLQALLLGGALGLVAYGTYDFTNLAVISGFGLRIALIDLLWGTVLSGGVAALTVMLAGRLFGA